jgi:hypothetical protein
MSEAVHMVESEAGAVETARSTEAAAVSFEEFVAARSRDLWRSAWLLTGDHAAHQVELRRDVLTALATLTRGDAP